MFFGPGRTGVRIGELPRIQSARYLHKFEMAHTISDFLCGPGRAEVNSQGRVATGEGGEDASSRLPCDQGRQSRPWLLTYAPPGHIGPYSPNVTSRRAISCGVKSRSTASPLTERSMIRLS